MKFSSDQATKLAEQILKRFYYRIREACRGSVVDPDFMAAFCAIEAGKDRRGQISETATRFESGVFAKLRAVRDGGRQWSGIKTADLTGASDAALKALATSYGLTQIMGWHCIHNLKCTIAELRDPEKHLPLAVELLELVAKPYLKKHDFESVLRIWNSGSPTGKTYDPNYVYNALLVMSKISALRNSRPELVVVPDATARPLVADATKQDASVNATEQSQTQTVEQDGAKVEQTTVVKNEQDVNETAVVNEPKPQGILAKLGAGVATVFGGTLIYDAAGKFAGIQFSEQTVYIIIVLIVCALVGFVAWAILDAWKANNRVKIEALAATDITRKNLVFIPHDANPRDWKNAPVPEPERIAPASVTNESASSAIEQDPGASVAVNQHNFLAR